MSYEELAAKYAEQSSVYYQQVLRLEQELASRESLPICGTQPQGVSSLRADIDKKQSEIEQLRTTLHTQEIRIDDKCANVASLESELEKLQAELQRQNQLNLELQETLRTDENDAERKKQYVTNLEASIIGLKSELETAEAERGSERQQVQELKNTLKAHDAKKEQESARTITLESSVASLRADLEKKASQISGLNAVLATQKALADERNARIVDLMNLPSEEDEEQDSGHRQIAELCAAFKNRQTELQAFHTETAMLESNITALHAQVKMKERRIRELEQQVQSARSSASTTNSDDLVLLASQLAKARDEAEGLRQNLLQSQSDLAASNKDLKHSWEAIELWEERHHESSEHLGAKIRELTMEKLAFRQEVEELRKQSDGTYTSWDLEKAVEEMGSQM